MKKLLILATIVLFAAGCGNKTKTETFSGVIVDATMHTILLATSDTTTVWITTDKATDLSQCQGLIVGQSMKAKCNVVEDPVTELYVATQITAPDKPYEDYIVGSWVEPNPIAPDQVQGFTLYADGQASSVNMATLQYENWEIQDNKLILTFESIGNGQSFNDTATYKILAASSTSLVLQRGDDEQAVVYRYSRQ